MFAAINVPSYIGSYEHHADIRYGGLPRQSLDVYAPRGAKIHPREALDMEARLQFIDRTVSAGAGAASRSGATRDTCPGVRERRSWKWERPRGRPDLIEVP